MSKELFTGYLSSLYVESLEEVGEPYRLPRSGGTILKRRIQSYKYYDAMGIYPLFMCRDWRKLHVDLKDLKERLVSLSLVTDPFGDFDEHYLRYCFPDKLIQYKKHFVINLNFAPLTFVCKHHLRNARKALKYLFIERCEEPIAFVDEWHNLYQALIKRHGIVGIATFSKSSFEKQLSVPGIVAFRAVYGEETVGMLLWYIQDEKVGYYHLGAYSNRGYKLRASFGLFWIAIKYFASTGLRWLCLGGGAGIRNDGTDGLSRFKQGWATDTRPSFFCGRILNKVKYEKIIKDSVVTNTTYFPAYREGEFI